MAYLMRQFSMSKVKSKSILDANLPILIITCSASPPERIASALKQLEALNTISNIHFVNGYVSNDLIISKIFDRKRSFLWTKRPLSLVECAVYASHRKAHSMILEKGYKTALIMEDDFKIHSQETVENVIKHGHKILASGPDMLKLFDFRKKKKGNKPAISKDGSGINMVKWQNATAGAVAYVISAQGAKKFLRRKKIFRQIDEDTKYFWELGLDIWSVPGCPIRESATELGGSLVEESRIALHTDSILRKLWGNCLTVHRKIRAKWALRKEIERYLTQNKS